VPFCPNCRSEFRAGFEVCVSCDNTPLVAELLTMVEIEPGEDTAAVSISRDDHANPRIEMDGETYDVAYIHPIHRAIDFKRVLSEQKIAAVILEIPKLVLPGDQPAFEVHVRASKLEEAQELLLSEWSSLVEENKKSEELATDACPACGAHVPMDVEECPDCGLVVGVGEEEDDESEEADESGENENAQELAADACPACGARVSADVQECPDCGLVVGFGEEEGEE
jgi:hypothetical protein